MDNTADNDRAAKKLEQVAEGFAMALVTSQLIDEQMEVDSAVTHDDIEILQCASKCGVLPS